MKRWGAALACGLILSFGFAGVGHAAEAPTCTPMSEGGFGTLAPAQIGTATLASGETACHTVELTAGAHYIQFTSLRVVRTAAVLDARGATVCTAPVGYQWTCDIPSDGTYTIQVKDTYTFGLTYQVAAISQGAATCTTKVGTAWNAARVKVPTTDLEAHCVRFSGQVGDKIQAFSNNGRLLVRDSADNLVCELPQYFNDPCVLAGRAPFRAMSVAGTGNPTNEIQVGSLSPAVGCPVATPVQLADPWSDNRCRTIIVPTAGKYFLNSWAEDNNFRNLVIRNAAGTPVCDVGDGNPGQSNWICDLQPGRYTAIADGATASIIDQTFVSALVPLDSLGCRPWGTDVRTVFSPNRTIDCFTFKPKAGTAYVGIDVQKLSGTGEVDAWGFDATQRTCYQDRVAGLGVTCQVTNGEPLTLVLSGDRASATYRIIRTDFAS